MEKTIKLKDGEAKIGQTVWYVNTNFSPKLGSIFLSESHFVFRDEHFNESVHSSSPCFLTKTALLAYCQENDIECIELERDVYKERLAELEKPKTDIEKFLGLCRDFGLNVSEYGIKDERFVSLWDNDFETRFVFDANGAFVNDFNTQRKED